MQTAKLKEICVRCGGINSITLDDKRLILKSIANGNVKPPSSMSFRTKKYRYRFETETGDKRLYYKFLRDAKDPREKIDCRGSIVKPDTKVFVTKTDWEKDLHVTIFRRVRLKRPKSNWRSNWPTTLE